MPDKRSKISTPKKKEPPNAEGSSHRGRKEFWGLFSLSAACFLLLCLLSYDPRDPSFNAATSRPEASNLCGLLGSHLADAMVQMLGVCSLTVPFFLGMLSLRVLGGRGLSMKLEDAAAGLGLLAAVCLLIDRFGLGGFLRFPVEQPGGALGSFVHGVFLRLFGTAGEMVVGMAIVAVCLLQLSGASLPRVGEAARTACGFLASAFAAAVERVKSHLRSEPLPAQVSQIQPLPEPMVPTVADPEERCLRIVQRADSAIADQVYGGESSGSWERISVLPRGDCEGRLNWALPEPGEDTLASGTVQPEPLFPWRRMEVPARDDGLDRASIGDEDLESAIEDYLREQALSAPIQPAPEEPASDATEPEPCTTSTADLEGCAGESEDPPAEPLTVKTERHPTLRAPEAAAALPRVSAQAQIGRDPQVELRVAKRADEEVSRPVTSSFRPSADHYEFPPTDLLDAPSESNRSVDRTTLEANAVVLEQKLSDLGVDGKVVAIHPGPVITMYELSLASGVPLRKILNMSDDLAMALKSGSTRIVAPIPGKDTVGIEVPNLNREIVHFREIVESSAFRNSDSPLKMALGKGIDGEPFASSLPRMPHLLIAGATGTGKSVGLNCLICSWLMSCHPDDLKLLLVDPKKLELSHYEDVPHLIHPVVTDPEKVPAVLLWAIREMERRYDLLSKVGAKNIQGYNQKIRSGEVSAPDGEQLEKLPYIVIIVDELAELMMVAAKDIEISIARLAQMARASGIHLILATQRPSVDVITGIIKANFPARLSFQVSAKADSRTILDTVGAENLLGMGDMLFLPPGASKLRRLHGAYISEKEIGRIVDFIKAQRKPVYISEISRQVSEDGSKQTSDLIQEDKYDEAVELVCRLGHASISLIQRHMRIGYNRAARIMEAMECEGIVGPSDGTSRPREVLARSLSHVPDHA